MGIFFLNEEWIRITLLTKMRIKGELAGIHFFFTDENKKIPCRSYFYVLI